MLISIAQAQQFFLVLTRVLAMLIHVPVLGGGAIPNRVRIALGILLSVVLIPWQPLGAEAAAEGLFGFAFAIGRELVIGTLAGFPATLAFAALQVAGEAMGLGSGFSSGRILNPTMGTSGSALDQMFVTVAMLYFLLINGHHAFIMAMGRTFEIVPVNSALPAINAEMLMALTAQMITTGVQLALPVMGTLLMTDLTLGLLARVAPQVQVFFLGMPLKIGVGLIVFSVVFIVALPALDRTYGMIFPNMLRLMGE